MKLVISITHMKPMNWCWKTPLHLVHTGEEVTGNVDHSVLATVSPRLRQQVCFNTLRTWTPKGIEIVLMASHVYLALRSRIKPVRPAEWGDYLAGAVAPDVRYLAPTLPREASHSWKLGLDLAGPFGAGYRHHLAVDRSFYRRCEEQNGLGRLGAMNLTILAELYALRRLTDVPALGMTAVDPSLLAAGVPGEALTNFLVLSNDYLRHREIDQAVQLLTGSLRERAARYLDKWARWGNHLRLASTIATPILHHLFGSIQAEAEQLLAKARP